MTFHPLAGWKEALSQWGWAIPTALIAVVIAVVMIGLPEAGVDTNPTRNDGEDINVVFSPSDDEDRIVECPDGWSPFNRFDQDLLVIGCSSGDPADIKAGDWLVILTENDDGKFNKFNVGYQVDTPDSIFYTNEDEFREKVPEWQ